MIRGICSKSDTYFTAFYEYIYQYDITFRIKDGKFKISIENVHCLSAICTTGDGIQHQKPKIEPFDGNDCPDINGFSGGGIPKKKMIPLMASVKKEIQTIFDSYLRFIKNTNSNDW